MKLTSESILEVQNVRLGTVGTLSTRAKVEIAEFYNASYVGTSKCPSSGIGRPSSVISYSFLNSKLQEVASFHLTLGVFTNYIQKLGAPRKYSYDNLYALGIEKVSRNVDKGLEYVNLYNLYYVELGGCN